MYPFIYQYFAFIKPIFTVHAVHIRILDTFRMYYKTFIFSIVKHVFYFIFFATIRENEIHFY